MHTCSLLLVCCLLLLSGCLLVEVGQLGGVGLALSCKPLAPVPCGLRLHRPLRGLAWVLFNLLSSLPAMQDGTCK